MEIKYLKGDFVKVIETRPANRCFRYGVKVNDIVLIEDSFESVNGRVSLIVFNPKRKDFRYQIIDQDFVILHKRTMKNRVLNFIISLVHK